MKFFLFHPTAHGKKARLFSCRIRLDGWQNARTFPLHVTDRRVASQKLAELLREIEQEQHASGGANAMKYRRFENHGIFWHTICSGFRLSEGGIEEEDDFFGMVKKIDPKNLGFQNADSSWVSARRSQK